VWLWWARWTGNIIESGRIKVKIISAAKRKDERRAGGENQLVRFFNARGSRLLQNNEKWTSDKAVNKAAAAGMEDDNENASNMAHIFCVNHIISAVLYRLSFESIAATCAHARTLYRTPRASAAHTLRHTISCLVARAITCLRSRRGAGASRRCGSQDEPS